MKKRVFEETLCHHEHAQSLEKRSIDYVRKHKDKEFMVLAFFNQYRAIFPLDPVHPDHLRIVEEGEHVYLLDVERDLVLFSSHEKAFYLCLRAHQVRKRVKADIWRDLVFAPRNAQNWIKVMPEAVQLRIYSCLSMTDLLSAYEVWRNIPLHFWRMRVPFSGILHPLCVMRPTRALFRDFPHVGLRLAKAMGFEGARIVRPYPRSLYAIWDDALQAPVLLVTKENIYLGKERIRDARWYDLVALPLRRYADLEHTRLV